MAKASAKRPDSLVLFDPKKARNAADLDLLRSASAKLASGDRLTREERAAVARYEKDLEVDLRAKFYAAIPLKDYRVLSGRDARIIKLQASTWGLPIGGRTINLGDVLASFHDLLAKWGRAREKPQEQRSEADELSLRERRIDVELKEARLREQMGQLVDREQVREGLTRVAATLRRLGDSLGKQFGRDAQVLLNESLDAAQVEIDTMFGSDGSEGPPANRE